MAQDPYRYFRLEARELLELLGRGALDLEKGRGAPKDAVASMLRASHTLKGAARVVRRTDIGDVAHDLEDVLTPYRGQDVAPSRADIDKLLALVDRIGTQVASLDAPLPVSAPAALAVQAPLSPQGVNEHPVPAPAHARPKSERKRRSERVPDEPARVLRAEVAEVDALIEGVAEAHSQLDALRTTRAATERIARLSELLVGQFGSARVRSPEENQPLLRSMAEDLRAQVGRLERELSRGLDQLGRELGQVRDNAEALRLVPARSMFTTLERVARDAAKELKKELVFTQEGGDTRLDGSVLAAAQSVLVQAVRNAVVHGLEAPTVRLHAGKEPEGELIVRVFRRGSRLLFTCRDDGAGIDVAAVRRGMIKRGRSQSEVDALSHDQVLAELLRAGISTSTQVTELAGRGVGLDLVDDVAQKLGGRAVFRSEPGKFTELELDVPATVSSLDVLVLEMPGQAAAVPLDAVRTTLRVAPSDIARTAEGAAILHEGKIIPFAPLEHALGRHVERKLDDRAWSAVVLVANGDLAAVGVDRLRGTGGVVVRPLPPLSPVDDVVMGASLDAAGTPQVVLDPERLVSALARPFDTRDTRKAMLPVLVIDDSLTTRMLEKSILESAGFEVDVAASAEEGLEKAKSRRYGLYLCDVEMPGMDGFGFVSVTRADPVLSQTPAILVTSRSAPEDKKRGFDAGASDYVVKQEFDQVFLLDRIRKLMGDK